MRANPRIIIKTLKENNSLSKTAKILNISQFLIQLFRDGRKDQCFLWKIKN